MNRTEMLSGYPFEDAFARIVSTHDAQEGVAAFLEKRTPEFLGR